MMEINTLPHDLIIEILSRLPVKTLCQFKCVSKQWLFLLSHDKSFISKHHQLSKRTPLLLFRKYSSSSSTSPVSQDEEVEKYQANIELTSMDMEGVLINKLVSSIGGPVYTFISCGPLVVICWAYRLCVCNPSTREFVRLPRSCSVSQYDTIGFGYVPYTNEYKIVHLFTEKPFLGESDNMGCEIFSLRDGDDASSGSWRRIHDYSHIVHTNCSSICLNGVLYWKISDQVDELNRDASVLSFDLEKEEFKSIPHPKCCSYSSNGDQNSLFLTVFKGHLCLVSFSGQSKSKTMNIWLLKEQNHHPNWVKFSGFDSTNLEIKSVFPSLDHDGELLVNTKNEGLVYYNIERKSFRAVKNTGTVECYKKPCVYYDGFFSLTTKPCV